MKKLILSLAVSGAVLVTVSTIAISMDHASMPGHARKPVLIQMPSYGSMPNPARVQMPAYGSMPIHGSMPGPVQMPTYGSMPVHGSMPGPVPMPVYGSMPVHGSMPTHKSD
jgi:hypothetical protein